MGGTKPLLTISLLSSGRGDTIERCLASLAPIRDRLDAELVVVDTDPEGGAAVRGVLERYADKIIPFAWTDDFSAARNAGVDAAAGEWFCYLDDDEWFIDAEPLIEFFRSGEYRNHAMANYLVRNFADDGFKAYSDDWVTRLFSLGGGRRFRGFVHEYPSPVDSLPIGIRAIVGHTGYVNMTEEKRKEKSRRNLPLVRKEIARDPGNIRWHFQLMADADAAGDRATAEEACRTALRILEGDEDPNAPGNRGAFAAELIRLAAGEGDWDGACRRYEKMTRDARYGGASSAYMELLAAQAYFNTGEYDRSLACALSYLEYYDRMHGRENEFCNELVYFLKDAFSADNYVTVVDNVRTLADITGDAKARSAYEGRVYRREYLERRGKG